MFRLSRPVALRITIVRVYPSCGVVGSFAVRGRAGVNRIRFRGRFRGRPLPAGGYRLVIRARGAARDAAAVPVVVARKPMSRKALRRARSTVVCNQPVAELGVPDAIAAAGILGAAGGSGGVLGKVAGKVKEPLGSAAGAIADTARRVVDRATIASDASLLNRLVLTVIAAIVLLSAVLGGLTLAQLLRAGRYRGNY